MSEFARTPVVATESELGGITNGYEQLRLDLEQEMWRSVKASPTGGIEGLNLRAGVDVVTKLQKMEASGGEGRAEAGKYAGAVLDLMKNDDLALAQAKVALDLREIEKDGKHSLDDLERRRLIKEKGVFTMEEYKLLRAGRNWGEPVSEPVGRPDEGGSPNAPKAPNPEPGGFDNPDNSDELNPNVPDNPDDPDDQRATYEREVEAYRGNLSVDFLFDYAMAEQHLTGLMARRERVHGIALRHTKKELAEARQKYDDLRMQAKKLSEEGMKKAGMSREAYLLHSKMDDESENRYLALNTAAIRHDWARPSGEGHRAQLTQKFYNWWIRGGAELSKKQKIFNRAKKMAVLAGATVPVGIVAGVFLPASAGIGAAAGAVIAYRGAKSYGLGFGKGKFQQNAAESSGARARSLKDVEANTGNIAVAQALQRMQKQQEAIDRGYATDKLPAGVSGVHVEGANDDVRRNRWHVGAATLLGAGLGVVGAEFGHLISDAVGGGAGHVAPTGHGGGHHPNGGQHSGGNHPAPAKPSTQPPVHGTTGQEFDVEQGSGEIREIQEYASSHNYNVNPQQAYQIYEQLYQAHGADIIKLDGSGPSTYVIAPGDVGLSHPGMAQWYPGVETQLRQMLETASKQNT